MYVQEMYFIYPVVIMGPTAAVQRNIQLMIADD